MSWLEWIGQDAASQIENETSEYDPSEGKVKRGAGERMRFKQKLKRKKLEI